MSLAASLTARSSPADIAAKACVWLVVGYLLILEPAANLAFAALRGHSVQPYVLYASKGFLLIPSCVYFLLKFEAARPVWVLTAAAGVAAVIMAINGLPNHDLPVYYVSDVMGILYPALLATLIYVSAKEEGIRFWFVTIVSAGTIMAIVTLANVAIHSSTGKNWLPPQLEVAATLSFGAVALGLVKPRLAVSVAAVLILLASYFSMLRVSMATAVLAVLTIAAFAALSGRWTRSAAIHAAAVVGVVAAVVAAMPDILQSRVATLSIITSSIDPSAETNEIKADPGVPDDAMFLDSSANQRFLEAQLVLETIGSDPIAWLIGHGAGATFANDGSFTSYGDRVHNVHSTPFTLLLRAGLVGVCLYLAACIFAAWKIFTWRPAQFVLALALGLVLSALLFNQFFFWGTYFAIALGLLLAISERKEEGLA